MNYNPAMQFLWDLHILDSLSLLFWFLNAQLLFWFSVGVFIHAHFKCCCSKKRQSWQGVHVLMLLDVWIGSYIKPKHVKYDFSGQDLPLMDVEMAVLYLLPKTLAPIIWAHVSFSLLWNSLFPSNTDTAGEAIEILSCRNWLTNRSYAMNRLSKVHRRTNPAANSISDEAAEQYASPSLSGSPVTAPVQQRTCLTEGAAYRADKLLWCLAFKKVWFHTVSWMSKRCSSVTCTVALWEVKGSPS